MIAYFILMFPPIDLFYYSHSTLCNPPDMETQSTRPTMAETLAALIPRLQKLMVSRKIFCRAV